MNAFSRLFSALIFAGTICACSHSGHRQISPEQMQAGWAKASTPTKEHALLRQLAGTWKAKASWRMSPEQPAEVTPARTVNTMEYGGKFLKEVYTGKIMGKNFSGTGYVAYDTVAEKFVTTWMDSMSTALMVSKGRYNPETREITFYGKASCPFQKGPVKIRSVIRFVSPRQYDFEMYTPGAHGKEFLSLAIQYTK